MNADRMPFHQRLFQSPSPQQEMALSPTGFPPSGRCLAVQLDRPPAGLAGGLFLPCAAYINSGTKPGCGNAHASSPDYPPTGRHQPQSQLLTDRAVFSDAYAVILLRGGPGPSRHRLHKNVNRHKKLSRG